jgi:hypothetical protein
VRSHLQVVAVVEAADEVRQPLGRVCGEVVHVIERPVLGEQLRHEGGVFQIALGGGSVLVVGDGGGFPIALAARAHGAV